MKKKMIIGTLSAVFVLGGAFAVGASNNDDGSKVEAKANNTKTILGYDEVKKIALQEVDGVVEEIELEREANTAVYEVDIEKDDIDYDLHIDAYSGEIYSVDRDDDGMMMTIFQIIRTSFPKRMPLPLLKRQQTEKW